MDRLEIGSTLITVKQTRWLDERIGCTIAHHYLAGAIGEAEFGRRARSCPFYRKAPNVGDCLMNGRDQHGFSNSICLYHEDIDSPSWQDVRQWRKIVWPDGSSATVPAQYAQRYAEELGATVLGGFLIVR